jgi:hypothetical protein
MGLIKEPLNIDFEFNPKPLSAEERQRISEYIKSYKARNLKKKSVSKQKKVLLK